MHNPICKNGKYSAPKNGQGHSLKQLLNNMGACFPMVSSQYDNLFGRVERLSEALGYWMFQLQ